MFCFRTASLGGRQWFDLLVVEDSYSNGGAMRRHRGDEAPLTGLGVPPLHSVEVTPSVMAPHGVQRPLQKGHPCSSQEPRYPRRGIFRSQFHLPRPCRWVVIEGSPDQAQVLISRHSTLLSVLSPSRPPTTYSFPSATATPNWSRRPPMLVTLDHASSRRSYRTILVTPQYAKATRTIASVNRVAWPHSPLPPADSTLVPYTVSF